MQGNEKDRHSTGAPGRVARMFTALVEGGNKYLRNPGQNNVTALQQRQQGEKDAKGMRTEARRCKGPCRAVELYYKGRV